MTPELPGPSRLLQRIQHEIRANGALTFAHFMELALHHPDEGYYAAGSERLGERGDFITASDLGPALGACLARQITEFDTLAGTPPRFDLVEFGAGRGWLARDLLAGITRGSPELAQRVHYTAVDASPGMRRAIAANAPQATPCAPEDLAPVGVGCVIAVELFDALPVHRVRRRAGKLEELGVGLRGAELCEVAMDAAPEVGAWAERYGAAREEGDEAEVCLALDRMVGEFDRVLERGFLLVLDYGATADKLYVGSRRHGTLLAYHKHQTNEQYLQRVGEQDLTAHVNFSAMRDAAERRGWQLLGDTTQDRFLIANGILQVFEQLDEESYRDPVKINQRLRIKQLIQPGGMGRIFQVWVFSKGLDGAPKLAGLVDPFAR